MKAKAKAASIMLDNVLYLANVTDTSRPPESAAHTNLRRQPHQNVYKKRESKREMSAKDQYEQKLRRAISIDALLSFLHDVLKMRQHYTEAPVNKHDPDRAMPSLFNSPASRSAVASVTNDNIHSARQTRRTNDLAAKAYQRAAHSSQDNLDVPHEEKINSANTKLLGVMDHDAAEIFGVIRDLQLLRRRGVAHLVVSRGDDFVQSVQGAISALKNA
jgi:hypothetical protein